MMLLKIHASTISLASIGAALCLWAGSCPAQSAEPAGSGLRVSGFGTLGVVHSDAPAGWGFLRNIDQPDNHGGTRADIDSRLGLQLNYVASSQIELVSQLLATRRSSDSAATDALEWAFVAYRPTSDVTLRVGRLNLDQFLLSDYRNVGFAYLFARPPVEFYGSIPTSLDGADITRTWNLADAQWRAKAFVGRAKIVGIDLTPGYGVTLSREADGLLVRAGLSRARFANTSTALQPVLDGLGALSTLPVPAVAAQADALRTRLDYAGTALNYATLGINYDPKLWQWTAELTRVSGGPNTTVVAGYAGVGRRVGAVTLFGAASAAKGNGSPVVAPAWGVALAPVLGPAAAQQAQLVGYWAAFAASQTIDQHTLSIGARWDFHPRMALKVQWDHVQVNANGSQLWSNATLEPERAEVGTVLLDFVF
jgi:hypothetical protein